MTSDLCLVCHQAVFFVDTVRTKLSAKTKSGGEKLSAIESQLKVIFVLKELFQIPVDTLEQCFVLSNGKNPDLWVGWCEECDKNICQAYLLFMELNRIRQNLRRVQNRLVEKVKNSFAEDENFAEKNDARKITKHFECDAKDTTSGQQSKIVKSFRAFIYKHNYANLFDCPTDGDTRAEAMRCQHKLEENVVERPSNNFELKEEPEDWNSDFDEPEIQGSVSETVDNDQKATITDTQLKNKAETGSGVTKRKRAKRKPLMEYEGAVMGADGKVVFACQVEGCGKVLKDRRDYHYHTQRHSGITRPKLTPEACDECGIVLSCKSAVNAHKARIHQGKRKKQTEAQKEKRREEYKLKKNFEKCPHCDYCAIRYNLEQHINRKHRNACSHFCEICGKGVKSTSELRYHKACEHRKCSAKECELSFETNEQLRNHQVTEHGRELDVFECKFCNKLFMSRFRLKKHLKIHEFKMKVEECGDRNLAGGFICDLCGKGFALKDYLDYHQWDTHMKQRKAKQSAN